ncbi:MAG: 50S ribosomal protein L18 [Spirochaetota bacterium]
MMNRLKLKKVRYMRRRMRVKSKIRTNTQRPRMCISRSNKNFYVQIIDDSKGHTLVSASTLEKDFPISKNRCNKVAAKELGKIIAQRAVAKNIKQVVFDRNGYLYHGKVKEFADAARQNGLEF